MTPLPTQSSATDVAADPALSLMAPAEPEADRQEFEKVFREATDEAEASENNDPRTEQSEPKEPKGEDKAKRTLHPDERNKHLNALQANKVSKAKVKSSSQSPQSIQANGKQAANEQTANAQTDANGLKAEAVSDKSKKGKAESDESARVKSDGNKVDEQKALQARKQANAKRTGRLKKQQAARNQLKAKDLKHAQTKAELEAARQKLPSAAVIQNGKAKSAQTADKARNLPAGEWELVNGTQIAQNNAKMAMMAKTTTPAPEGSVARWEELRPATSAELGGGASGQQQDLPREQAREFTLPVQAASATPAATGTAATQAFTPAPGQISATLEKIWNAVTTFRAKGVDQWSVKLQADNQQMELSIRYNQGGLEIQARLGQGDGRSLAGQWNELQQTLAERGVTLRDLEREEAQNLRFSGDLDDFDSSESRRHASAGEEDEGPLNWGEMVYEREEEEQPAPRRAPARAENANWESWA